jgi:hypothetical protein
MFDGMSIYVCSDLLNFFVSKILPNIKNNFVLVSGDSDLNTPLESLTKDNYDLLINCTLLIHWFAQNTRIQYDSKIIQLPIGLDYHTIENNSNHEWKMEKENHLTYYQEEILLNIRKTMKPFNERINKIYINFSKNNDRFGQRKSALDEIPKDLMANYTDFIKRTKNWQNITEYSFVLSPFGVGMDCHRTWETLCLGAIPILKAPYFKKMFEDLPVLIVNEWSEITEDLLKNTILNFTSKTFNYNKLTLEYWIKQINSKNNI